MDLSRLDHLMQELRCICPCHDPAHPLKVHHAVACCCVHRHVVPEECEECQKQVATSVA